MYFFIYGGVAAILMFSGLSLGGVRSNLTKVLSTIATFVVFGLIGWLRMPVFAWNFVSNWLLLTIIGGLIVLIVAGSYFLERNLFFREYQNHRRYEEDKKPAKGRSPLIWTPLAIGLIMMIPVQLVSTWSLFHADSYHRLLGDPTVSEFNVDVSPVNIDQVRRVDQDLAYTLGSKRIEEQPGLGSRVNLGTMNIQTINGCFGIRDGNDVEHNPCFENELVWVGPLVHADFFKWLTNSTTPGYIIVSATDPTKVHLVTAIKSGTDVAESGTVDRMGSETSQTVGFEPIKLRFLNDGSYWGDYLVRHVRTSGYAADGLTDYSFEIDNSGRPHWVITHYDRTIGFGGADARGVVTVDAQTGTIGYHSIAEAPTWIDRIQPETIVSAQLNDWGSYINGFWNAMFAKADVVQITPGMSLVYGADGRSYWYSGIQSAGSDTGTNSFVLVDTRTKEVRRYMITGANESAARASAENAPGVREAGFSGTNPILYNISNEPTYFLTLKGGDGLVKMFAFVSVKNYETVGVGRSVSAALRDYQNALIREGQSIDLQDLTSQERIEAVVMDVVQIDDTFYLLLGDQSGVEFYGTSDVSPELKWARTGQNVVLIVQRGDSSSLQIYAFDIPSLTISTLQDDES